MEEESLLKLVCGEGRFGKKLGNSYITRFGISALAFLGLVVAERDFGCLQDFNVWKEERRGFAELTDTCERVEVWCD